MTQPIVSGDLTVQFSKSDYIKLSFDQVEIGSPKLTKVLRGFIDLVSSLEVKPDDPAVTD